MAKISGVLFSLLLLAACGGGGGGDSPAPAAVPKANFELVSYEKTTTSWGDPSLTITIKNTGTGTGYNLGCDIKAHDAAGVIIDDAKFFPAALGDILVGESVRDEAVFFNLHSHSDYASLTYDCTWLTRK